MVHPLVAMILPLKGAEHLGVKPADNVPLSLIRETFYAAVSMTTLLRVSRQGSGKGTVAMPTRQVK